MLTWEDYKKHVREKSPEIGQDIDDIERISSNMDLDELNRKDPAALVSILCNNSKESSVNQKTQ